MNIDTTSNALPPHYYEWPTIFVTGCSLYLFYPLNLTENFAYLPIPVFSVIYALFYFVRQRRHQSRYSIEKNIDLEDYNDPAIRFLPIGKQIGKQILNSLSGAKNKRPAFHVLKPQNIS